MTRVRLAALILGLPFGFTIAWSGMNDPDVIGQMMLLENFYLYKMFAAGVTLGLAGSLLLRRMQLRALITRERLTWETPRPQARHVTGSLIFGSGWALASSCPGPIATQLGTGLWWSAITITGIVTGVLLYLRRHAAPRTVGLLQASAAFPSAQQGRSDGE